jgi:hypothetical protein
MCVHRLYRDLTYIAAPVLAIVDFETALALLEAACETAIMRVFSAGVSLCCGRRRSNRRLATACPDEAKRIAPS